MEEPTLLAQQQRLLSSWKEIAQYFGRGVRTVQRWETTLGLPVRRPHGRSRSAVMAIAGELDEWLSRARLRPEILNDGNGKFSDANGNFGDGNGKREPDGEDDRLFFLFLGGGAKSKLRKFMAAEPSRTCQAEVCRRSDIGAAGA